MKIITQTVTLDELKQMSATFGNMVKAVVDIDREFIAVDAELHSDLEALLLKDGSKQKSLWGINIYPEIPGDDFIEYDSMINMRHRRSRCSQKNHRPRSKKDPAMSYQHKELAAGRWAKLPFVEQMANIGSEVERALNWQEKNNPEYSQKAFERSLELIDLTLDSNTVDSHIKEIARLREFIVDYFYCKNEFRSTAAWFRKYFLQFNYAAAKRRGM
jgi:hypothetical protein